MDRYQRGLIGFLAGVLFSFVTFGVMWELGRLLNG